MKRKQALIRLEKAIIRESGYIESHGLAEPVQDWDKQRRDKLRQQLETRRQLLNEMFLCTEEEVADFRKINDRLYELTQKMHEKALQLYRNILQSGFDPDFDDDIMVEGSLRFVFCGRESAIWTEEEKYGSNFPAMLEILSEYYDHSIEPDCASCRTSYSTAHHPDMDAADIGLENFLDDGETWADGAPLKRKEWEDICICHAVYDLCCDKLYSVPDLLRMNDFWCEVKVTHQLLSDRDGKRVSYIVKEED